MKKLLSILLAAVMVLQGGLFTVVAEDPSGTEKQISRIDISSIGIIWTDGKVSKIIVKFDPEGTFTGNFGPGEVIISGDDIDLKNGKYNFELKANEGFVFKNDLEINYQGVEGKYNLDYSFPNAKDQHTMIVSGDFKNIITASPLVDKIDLSKLLALAISGNYSQAVDLILDDGTNAGTASIDEIKPITDDSYTYKLVLKTKEGFSFNNTLQFYYDEQKYGYSLDYDYDLSTNRQTLTIKGLAEKKQEESTEEETVPPGSDPDQKGKDGTAVGPGASEASADKAITTRKSETDPKGSVFNKLRLGSPKQTKSSITLSWKKQSKAVKYVIYGSKCGKTTKPKKLATVTGKTTKVFSKVAGKKLKKGTYYKFIVVAIDKNNNVVSTSTLCHVATKGSKYCNFKSVTVKKSVLTKAKKLKKGKTLKLKAKAVKQSKKLKVSVHRGVKYESSNKKIATVSKSGKVTAKKKGSCYIYAYAQNGVFKKIKVVVR